MKNKEIEENEWVLKPYDDKAGNIFLGIFHTYSFCVRATNHVDYNYLIYEGLCSDTGSGFCYSCWKEVPSYIMFQYKLLGGPFLSNQ